MKKLGSGGALEATAIRALGVNCGAGPCEMITRVRALGAGTTLPNLTQPVAGLPELTAGQPPYCERPEAMAMRLALLMREGASIQGGGSGATADHARAITVSLRRLRRRPRAGKSSMTPRRRSVRATWAATISRRAGRLVTRYP